MRAQLRPPVRPRSRCRERRPRHARGRRDDPDFSGRADADRPGRRTHGRVAERTGLSLRTVRCYEENGLVLPTARSEGAFRLYSGEDVASLRVVKRTNPLGFTLEEMHELLGLLHDLDHATTGRAQLVDRLRMFHEAAAARVTARREQLSAAEGFADTVADRLHAER